MKRQRSDSESDDSGQEDADYMGFAAYASDEEEKCIRSLEAISLATDNPAKAAATMAPRFDFTRGPKGALRTKHTKERSSKVELTSYMHKLAKCLGSSEAATTQLELIANYKANKQEVEADVLMSILIRSGISQRGMKVLCHIGSERFNRLREARQVQCSSLPRNGKEVTREMLDFFELDVNTWLLEEGFPCAHRRIKQYVSNGTTWKKLWIEYFRHAATNNIRGMEYKTWMQYRQKVFPTISLNRVKEDECDHCIKLQVLLCDENTSDADKAEVCLPMSCFILIFYH